MSEWREYRLADICVPRQGIQTGPFGSQLHKKDYVNSGTPIITVEHLCNNRITTQNLPMVSDSDKQRLCKYTLKKGDIVFSRVGSVDRRALIRQEQEGWLFSGRCLRVRLDTTKADPAFVSFQFGLETFKEYMRSIAVGATMPSLNTQLLSHVKILLPPLSEQKAIAHILGSLDDKIELNRRMNETLEAMARAIFKDWFVDFGPTRAKIEGRAPYLPEPIWSLFPDAIDPLSGLPIGWEEKPLDEIADFLNGLPLQKYPPSEDEESLPVIKIAELRSGVTAKSGRASSKIPDKYIVQDGDFLFSWSGSLVAKFWTGGKGALNQHLFKVKSDNYPTWFYTHWIYEHLENFRHIAASKATTMGHIQRVHLTAAKVICPQTNLMNFMSELVAPLLDKAIKNSIESRTLAELRDRLLPKLMSGQIRVKDAEKLVEEVL